MHLSCVRNTCVCVHVLTSLFSSFLYLSFFSLPQFSLTPSPPPLSLSLSLFLLLLPLPLLIRIHCACVHATPTSLSPELCVHNCQVVLFCCAIVKISSGQRSHAICPHVASQLPSIRSAVTQIIGSYSTLLLTGDWKSMSFYDRIW